MVSRILILVTLAVALALSCTDFALAQGGGSGSGATYTCDAPCGGDTTVWPWQYSATPYNAYVYDHGCQFNNPQTCCQVSADYRYRHVCISADFIGFYQVEILSLSWDRDCIIRGQSAIFDPVPMIRAITYGLLRDNPMKFSLDLGNPDDHTMCLDNYTVAAASCWKSEPGMNHAENCGADTAGYACCKGGYRICRAVDQSGNVYRDVHWLAQSTVWNNCIAPCKPSCGAFNDDSIYTRKKDVETPSLSATPSPSYGITDPVTVSTSTEMTEQKAKAVRQRR